MLSASGTAAIVKLQQSEMDSSMISNKDVDFKRDNLKSDVNFCMNHFYFKIHFPSSDYLLFYWKQHRW